MKVHSEVFRIENKSHENVENKHYFQLRIFVILDSPNSRLLWDRIWPVHIFISRSIPASSEVHWKVISVDSFTGERQQTGCRRLCRI